MKLTPLKFWMTIIIAGIILIVNGNIIWPTIKSISKQTLAETTHNEEEYYFDCSQKELSHKLDSFYRINRDNIYMPDFKGSIFNIDTIKNISNSIHYIFKDSTPDNRVCTIMYRTPLSEDSIFKHAHLCIYSGSLSNGMYNNYINQYPPNDECLLRQTFETELLDNLNIPWVRIGSGTTLNPIYRYKKHKYIDNDCL